jgi:uncharacterized alkaline shock family protein YloU
VEEKLGKVTIAPNVLVTIVQKTSMSEPGVAQLCENVPGVKRLLGLHTVSRGVVVSVEGNSVTVNVHLIARRGVDLLQLGLNLQKSITRAMQEIVGMEVCEVNIHVDDIATELSKSPAETMVSAG